MNHAISGEILVQEVRFPRSEIFLATLVYGNALNSQDILVYYKVVIMITILIQPLFLFQNFRLWRIKKTVYVKWNIQVNLLAMPLSSEDRSVHQFTVHF